MWVSRLVIIGILGYRRHRVILPRILLFSGSCIAFTLVSVICFRILIFGRIALIVDFFDLISVIESLGEGILSNLISWNRAWPPNRFQLCSKTSTWAPTNIYVMCDILEFRLASWWKFALTWSKWVSTRARLDLVWVFFILSSDFLGRVPLQGWELNPLIDTFLLNKWQARMLAKVTHLIQMMYKRCHANIIKKL